MEHSLLIVEDEETLRESLKRLFSKEGYRVETAPSAEEALKLIDEENFDVIISDIILPGMDGIEMLTRIRDIQPDQIFIVVTAYASLDTAVKALRIGAYDYIIKPIIHEEIKQVVRNALRQQGLERENQLLRRQVEQNYDFSSIIGEGGTLKGIIEEVRKISNTKSNVLILGETGTGKELFARVIHKNSARANMPFVPINCSAIPEPLLESELFGHVRGAFTGAMATKMGLFEEANGGTVFLDEIGDMPPAVQVKLLRVLEDQEIRPVGSTKSKRIDIRFISATNRDIREAVRDGDFREDLYYRINVISLEMPPLRERREDLSELLSYYLDRYSREFGKPPKTIPAETLGVLQDYAWPGNIRELQNVIERAVLISDGDAIMPEHLPENIHNRRSFAESSMENELSIKQDTQNFIINHQQACSEQELADKLGITRKTLWEKRKKWGIPRPS